MTRPSRTTGGPPRRAGARSTGHAFAGGRTWGPIPAVGPACCPPTRPIRYARPAGPAADSSVAALVAGVSRGLLVTDFWYTRVLDPRPLVVTGLTRNGVWLIENGEITRPVQNFRFTQSYPQALAPGAVLGVGSAPGGPAGRLGPRSFAAPALHLASWNFTGGASG